jgi:hypothetical protein
MQDQNIQLNKPDNAYIYKKTEKLVSAIYLLSSFISDREPVKWQLRETGLKLLSQSLPLSDRPIQGVSLISLILSLLEASYIGGIISQMNYNILKFEFEGLARLVEVEEQERIKGAIFSEQFFGLPLISKGQDNMSDRLRPLERSIKDKTNKPSFAEATALRQDSIIALLKDKKELGIKDFTLAIKGCSEKTIQRELVSLVNKGLVRKEGKKRWSRYFIK